MNQNTDFKFDWLWRYQSLDQQKFLNQAKVKWENSLKHERYDEW